MVARLAQAIRQSAWTISKAEQP